MRYGGGLSQKQREERITSVHPLAVVNGSMALLLSRLQAVASCIRYYNFDAKPDGYFDEFLRDLKRLQADYESSCEPLFNGSMEPAQAQLLNFVCNLHDVATAFNKRWEELPYWYFEQVVGVKDCVTKSKTVWVSLSKDSGGQVYVPKGAEFALADGEQTLLLGLTEDLDLEDVKVQKAFAVYYGTQANLYPASLLDAVTSISVEELTFEADGRKRMFPCGISLPQSHPTGFIIASPSLLLREGKRVVTVTLESESEVLTELVERARAMDNSPFASMSDAMLYANLLNNIFYVQLSNDKGWTTVETCSVKLNEQNTALQLKFTLSEAFPATVACTQGLHGIESEYPALKVLFNFDAWLFPYSWLKDIMLKRISIQAHVEGLSSLLVYNDLGQVDVSKPFPPFGSSTERGAWFTVGCYEVAIKNTLEFSLLLQWSSFVNNDLSILDYYKDYRVGVDNTSFKLEAKYLDAYCWQHDAEQQELYLFATDAESATGAPLRAAALSTESVLKNVRVKKMPAVDVAEQDYVYSVQAKCGFVSFVLSSPDMGFGEKRYRQLFAEEMMLKKLKKQANKMLNPPISPLLERIMLNYDACDCIDLRGRKTTDKVGVWHIHPLGYSKIYPNEEKKAVPLIYSMPHNAHLMFALGGVQGGEHLRLYLDFVSLNCDWDVVQRPTLVWFWGNGYTWHVVPDDMVVRDATKNMTTSGCLELRIPDRVGDNLFDDENLVWICASVVQGAEFIPYLKGIYHNAGELELLLNNSHTTVEFAADDGVCAVKNIPGVSSVKQLTALHVVSDGEESRLHKLMRVSEYVTHRGKAVTPRDFERLVLQNFTEIGKVKCLPDYDSRCGRSAVLTLVVVPNEVPESTCGWTPQCTSVLMERVEDFLQKRSSTYVDHIDVVNPIYEVLMVRCKVRFKNGYSSGVCRFSLSRLCDDLIAPWQQRGDMLDFDYALNLGRVRKAVSRSEYVQAVDNFSIVQLVHLNGERYRLHEFTDDEDMICPSAPHVVFVPADEHIFLCDETEHFGINEMAVNATFVVGTEVVKEEAEHA